MPVEIANSSSVEETKPLELSLAENLALVTEQTARLEAEVEILAGTGNYPEWWIQGAVSSSVVKEQLKEPGVDPKYIAEYFQLYKRQQEIRSAISRYHFDVDPLAGVYYDLGVETAAKGLLAEESNGSMHTAMIDQLTRAAAKDEHVTITAELDLLRQAYGKDSLTNLLEVRGDEYSDALKPLLRSETAIRAMRYADQGHSNNDTWHDIQTKAHTWMGRALSRATGIDEAEAAGYVFAASRRGEDKSMAEILNRFDYFGVERLRELAGFTGIHAFEDYSIDQLERMEELVYNPRSAFERLSEHDVNVVMVNRIGDYNGVMTPTADNFEDGQGGADSLL